MSGAAKPETKRGLLRSLVLLLPVAAALTFLLAGTALATDTTNPPVSFSLEPASSSSQPTGYFVISANPGDQVKESALLRNLTKDTIVVSLAAVDGSTGLYGGVTYGLPTDTAKHVGTWISFAQTQVTLKPDDSVEIPFTVNVPSDAPSGVNVGGLTAWIPAKKDNSTSTSEGFAAQIIIQTRRVIAVEVNLPGDSTPVLQIGGVTPVPRASGMDLDIAISNTGHGMAGGTASIDIPSIGFHKDFTVGDVLPGTSIAYPIQWATKPAEQAYDAKVSITYNGKTADWSGSFTIGQTAVSELKNYVTSTTANGQSASSGSGLSTTIIIIIAVAAMAWLIIVGAGVYLVLSAARRRRAREQAARPWEHPPSQPGETR
jgi:hypothetical protein